MKASRSEYNFGIRRMIVGLFMLFFSFIHLGGNFLLEEDTLSFKMEQTEEDVESEDFNTLEFEEELSLQSYLKLDLFFQEEKHIVEEIALLLPLSMSYLPSTPPPECYV